MTFQEKKNQSCFIFCIKYLTLEERLTITFPLLTKCYIKIPEQEVTTKMYLYRDNLK